MKLILCKNCHDVFKLSQMMRSCKCGMAKGRYLKNNFNAEYSGSSAVPLGFANSTLVKAIDNQPENGLGSEFVAFVIPKECPTMKRVEEESVCVKTVRIVELFLIRTWGLCLVRNAIPRSDRQDQSD